MRWRRITAFAIDWCCMLAWLAVLTVVGVSLLAAGASPPDDLLVQNLVGLSSIVPIVLGAAAFESSRRAATPGKRILGLAVEHAGEPPSFGRALARDSLKIGLPWTIGHVPVFALIDASRSGASPAWLPWLLAGAYAIPLVWLVSLLAPGGRTVYDRLSSTRVRRVAAQPWRGSSPAVRLEASQPTSSPRSKKWRKA